MTVTAEGVAAAVEEEVVVEEVVVEEDDDADADDVDVVVDDVVFSAFVAAGVFAGGDTRGVFPLAASLLALDTDTLRSLMGVVDAAAVGVLSVDLVEEVAVGVSAFNFCFLEAGAATTCSSKVSNREFSPKPN